LLLSRAETFCRRLRDRVWTPAPDVLVVEASKCTERLVPLAEARHAELLRAKAGDALGRRFGYVWYRVTISPRRGGDWLRWRHGGESTAYIDGKPWAGFDRQHDRFRLPDEADEVWIAVMHMTSGDALREVGLDVRDERAWGAWHDAEVLVDLARGAVEGLDAPYGGAYDKSFGYRPSLEFVPRSTRVILDRLDEASSAFERGGVIPSADVLDEALRALPADALQMPLLATAQAHLDPIHMWPEHVGRFKIVHTWATAAHLMDEYEDLHFLFSQPAAYAWVEEMEPSLLARVQERLREGRWEAEGAAWVEFDTNMPCGEAMLRALLIGQDRAREDAGHAGRILWLPDTFGYSACLPQLMRLAGVDSFWTTKLQWNAVTHFPLSSFRWKGPDGSEVVAHLAQHYMGYMVNGLPRQFQNIERIHRQSHLHNESIAPVGFGDGGGGITAEQIERTARCGDLHNVPKARFGNVAAFFERLHAIKDRLPTWRGEIYLQYHRGVLTSRRDMKVAYRRAERGLQTLEAAHAAMGGGAVDAAYWRRLCLMQFHDVITGSSLMDAIDACAEEMHALTDRAEREARRALGSQRGEACLFNPLPVERDVLLDDGRVLTLGPLEGRPRRDAAAKAPAVEASSDGLIGEGVEVSVDSSGCVDRLVIDGRPVHVAAPLGALWLYPEMPTAFDVWEIEEPSLHNGRRVETPATISSQRHADGSASLYVDRSIGNASSARVEYRLEPRSRCLRVVVDVDWQQPSHLLKMHFPTGYQGRMARYGCPFGSVLRSQHPAGQAERAQWEVGGSRWALVTDDVQDEGLWLVSRDSYGFSCRDGCLTVSLVRSPAPPEADAARLGRLLAQQDAYDESEMKGLITDLGRHRIELAIGRHDASDSADAHPAHRAESLFTPPLAYDGQARRTPLERLECTRGVVPAWAQPLEAGRLLVRLHEVDGRRGEVRIDPADGWQARRCDARGEGQGEPARIFAVGPYEVVSLLLVGR
jgi:alpha-mannosidase